MNDNGSDVISLWEAIKQMRMLTAEGKPFSFIHSTLDRSCNKTEGFRYVKEAKIRPAAKKDDLKEADHKLFYYDLELQQPRNCWQILIISFNGKLITL